MKVGVYANLATELVERALKYKNMGADYLELDLPYPLPEEDEILDKAEQVERIIPLPIVHLPEISYSWQEVNTLKEIIEAISSSSSYRKGFVIYLFGRKEVSFWHKKRAINEILKVTEEYDVPLAIENKSETRNVFRKVFRSFPELHMCFDIGHAHLYFPESEILQFVREFSEMIIHLHIHDNFGGGSEEWDLHLPLGMGSTNFEPILEEAKRCPRLKTVTMEVACFDDEYMFVSLKKLRSMINQDSLSKR